MNTITLYGRLGKDAEIQFLPSGLRVVILSLATNTKKAGMDQTIWWSVTVWGDQFKIYGTLLQKRIGVDHSWQATTSQSLPRSEWTASDIT